MDEPQIGCLFLSGHPWGYLHTSNAEWVQRVVFMHRHSYKYVMVAVKGKGP